jgi:hypothetical protein
VIVVTDNALDGSSGEVGTSSRYFGDWHSAQVNFEFHSLDVYTKVMSALPLVRFPARTAVFRFGAPSTASRASALLRFEEGLIIPKEGKQGWAIVGDGEGRRLAVEVSHHLKQAEE